MASQMQPQKTGPGWLATQPPPMPKFAELRKPSLYPPYRPPTAGVGQATWSGGASALLAWGTGSGRQAVAPGAIRATSLWRRLLTRVFAFLRKQQGNHKPGSRTWPRDFKWTASQKSRPIKHFAGRHRHCAAVGMVHRSGEDFPIFEGYRCQLEEALFPVR